MVSNALTTPFGAAGTARGVEEELGVARCIAARRRADRGRSRDLRRCCNDRRYLKPNASTSA
jgi:hypothetical protein